jgi:hypothetical protein
VRRGRLELGIQWLETALRPPMRGAISTAPAFWTVCREDLSRNVKYLIGGIFAGHPEELACDHRRQSFRGAPRRGSAEASGE